MTIDPLPHVRAVWAEANALGGDIIMGADTPSGLPWPKDDSDLRQFREDTRGHVLVMGSKTYDLLPAGLKRKSSTHERPIIILTSRIGHYINTTRGLGEAIQPINPGNLAEREAVLRNLEHWDEFRGKPVAVIGGPKVIEDFEPFYSELIVTHHFRGRFQGNVRAPRDSFLEAFKSDHSTLLDSGARRVVYTRRIPKGH
ncbi:dihydrofolate reductase [Microbacterium phage Franklin22]|uniref:dihydrofolate reductase n=1 Tax=Microbacterium phage Franklin22 TaxID=2894293 RepID=UPI001E7A0004|nr:dihydrofolate reductase [Microbacterium phage Franklin22]UGL61872.1 dihydrofolate reductase [Microbacterium phage Franklin22]